jgi:hemerythrin-like domain-containing protein
MDKLLAAIGSQRQVAPARRLLLRAVALCRRHFDKEERIVFPLAEKILSERTLKELGQRWEKQRKDLVA